MRKLILFLFLFSYMGIFAQKTDLSKFCSPAKFEPGVEEKSTGSPLNWLSNHSRNATPIGLKNKSIVNPI
ncbi:MAG: hypothetical protein JXA23_11420, partial [Bacteroidales bacterium]|nr:hypothetical protein [Bacteroidales bacterium]